jgi:hypothetical protein
MPKGADRDVLELTAWMTDDEGTMRTELLETFKRLYREEFREELSDQEALDKAVALLGLFRAVYRPIPMDKENIYKSLEQWYEDDEQTKT